MSTLVLFRLVQEPGQAQLALLEKALTDQDADVRCIAANALVYVGGDGDKAQVLLKKALADQDAKVRSEAAGALACIGGDNARDLLLGTLTGEKHREVLKAVSDALRWNFANDPVVVKALKDFKLSGEPPSQLTPTPEPESASHF